jgi:hypothetical protein
VSRQQRWLLVGLLMVGFFAGVAVVYCTLGRPPWWVRTVAGLALFLAVDVVRPPARAKDPAPAEDPAPEDPAPPAFWSVRLVDPGPQPVHVVRVLRRHLRLSRRQAEAIVAAAPGVAAAAVEEGPARRLAGDLTLVRAEATAHGPDPAPDPGP